MLCTVLIIEIYKAARERIRYEIIQSSDRLISFQIFYCLIVFAVDILLAKISQYEKIIVQCLSQERINTTMLRFGRSVI